MYNDLEPHKYLVLATNQQALVISVGVRESERVSERVGEVREG